MKSIIALFLLVPCLVLSEESGKTGKSKSDDGRTIVIQDAPGKLLEAPKVFVEAGDEDLAGSPEETMKGAYRTWEARCKEWKSELRQMNGSNLMVATCGKPIRSVEKNQSENVYTYTSKGLYKIKVIGK